VSDFLQDVEGSLSDRAQRMENLSQKIDWAERMVIDHFREHDRVDDDPILDDYYDSDVRLDGWKEDANGQPDVDTMDADLVARFRECMVRILEAWAEDPGEVESEIRGDRSWTYREDAGDVPSTVYNPLQPRDETSSFGFGL